MQLAVVHVVVADVDHLVLVVVGGADGEDAVVVGVLEEQAKTIGPYFKLGVISGGASGKKRRVVLGSEKLNEILR